MLTKDLLRLLRARTAGRKAYGLAGLCALLTSAQQVFPAAPQSPGGPAAADLVAGLPLRFEPNRGQTDAEVDFVARGRDSTLFLTGGDAVLSLQRDERTYVTRMHLAMGNTRAAATGEHPQTGRSSYFRGKDPEKWITDVQHFSSVRYEEVYPGIDLRYYGNRRLLEYDFIVAANVDPGTISLEFQGIERIEVIESGALVLTLPGTGGQVRFAPPVSYQQIDGVRRPVESRYLLSGREQVAFALGPYDASHTLVIDPVLAYGTYLGGSAGERGYTLEADGAGNAYISGYTTSNPFPTVGAYDATHNGGQDIFVTKLSADGSNILYSTYIGGSGDEEARDITVTGSGEAIVTGDSNSTNYPVTNGSSLKGAVDPVVTRLNADGNGLVYSGYYGGDTWDNGRGIAVDTSGNAYVTGYTRSSSGFPLTGGAYDLTHGGITEAFVIKLNGSGTVVYGTYLGGSNDEQGLAIVVDGSGNAHVTGYTTGSNFPTTGGAFDTSHNGGEDVFLTVLNAAGSALVYSTFLGSSGDDHGSDITLDTSDNIYLTGYARPSGFPFTAGAYDTTHNGNQDAFVTKFSAAKTMVFSTFYGGVNNDRGNGIRVDTSGRVYVAGDAQSVIPVTGDAFQSVMEGFLDTFFIVLDAAGTNLVYGTYLGGTKYDYGNALGLDNANNAYIAGQTDSTDFDTTPGAYDEGWNGGGDDVFVAKFGGFAAPSTAKAVYADTTATPKYSPWDGSSFGIEGSAATMAMTWRIIQGASSPDWDEKIVVGVNTNGVIRGQRWNGSAWGELPISPLGTASQSYWWGFDVAYESQSGDALLVWNDNPNLKYSVWDGSSWTPAATIGVYPGGEPRQMQLASHPGADEMVLVVNDASEVDRAMVWDGSAWGNVIQLDNDSGDDRTDIYVAYEQQSGRALVAYGSNSRSVFHYIWNGSSWVSSGSVSAPGSITGNARWTTLGPDPNSSRIALGVLTFDNEVWLSTWNGSGWQDTVETTGAQLSQYSTYPDVAVAFESLSGEAVATFGVTSTTPKYWTWINGSGWTDQGNVPTLPSLPNSMMLYPDHASDQIMYTVQSGSSGLYAYLWDGDSWQPRTELETDTGETKNQPFVFLWDLATGVRPGNQPPTTTNSTVVAWENAAYTFTVADFNYSDPDGDGLDHVQITSLESVGSLELSSVPVTTGQQIPTNDITLGNLTFVPVQDGYGSPYDSFRFRVHDGTDYSVPVSTADLIDATFDADSDGFAYADDVFSTALPAYAAGTYEAAGGFSGGGIRVYLGPGATGGATSGGWSDTINLGAASTVTVSLRYRMLMGEGYETTEYGEVILDIGGTRYGNDANDSLVHVDGNDNGGGTDDTGWLSDTFEIPLAAGGHTLTVGAYNNDATAADEWVEVFFDEISVTSPSFNTMTVDVTHQSVVVVTTTSDASDGNTSSIAALNADNGIDGGISLREAILACNNTRNGPSPDEIHFNLTGGAPYTIAPTWALPPITDPVVMDGTTQTEFAGQPIIELAGHLQLPGADALTVVAGDTTIRGFVINRFQNSGIRLQTNGTNVIEGNWIGLGMDGVTDQGNGLYAIHVEAGSSSNTIGGIAPGAGNVLSGNGRYAVYLLGTNVHHNTVQGNLMGTDVGGTLPRGGGLEGIYVSGSYSNLIGGTNSAARNVIADHTDSGIRLNGGYGNTVQGNYIGVDATGTNALPNGDNGIWVNASTANWILDNIVAASSIQGILVLGSSSSNTVIRGNFVGTDETGALDLGGNQNGIILTSGVSSNRIESNTVAFNALDGISIGTGTNNAILGNSVYNNGELGIDIGTGGVTSNDVNDVDTGGNNHQNFPALSKVTTSGSDIDIDGSLNSTPSTTFRIEFFANTAPDPSGNGEGERYLGFKSVTTDAGGNAFRHRVHQ